MRFCLVESIEMLKKDNFCKSKNKFERTETGMPALPHSPPPPFLNFPPGMAYWQILQSFHKQAPQGATSDPLQSCNVETAAYIGT